MMTARLLPTVLDDFPAQNAESDGNTEATEKEKPNWGAGLVGNEPVAEDDPNGDQWSDRISKNETAQENLRIENKTLVIEWKL